MSERPEHYTPQYINTGNNRNPFSPSYGLGQPRQGGFSQGGFQGSAPTFVIHQKSLLVAYLLWFFLGFFGIHKFYLRQPFMGLFYLILNGLGALLAAVLVGYFFWGLLALLWIIDAFTMPIRVSLMNALATRRVY